jgi:hypothetical protein
MDGSPKIKEIEKMRNKMVLIYLDQNNQIQCAPSQLHVRNGDQVRFHCEEDDFSVDFKNGYTPFQFAHYQSTAGTPTSEAPVKANAGSSGPGVPSLFFPYTINVQNVGSVDPQIIVDPYPLENAIKSDSSRQAVGSDADVVGVAKALEDVLTNLVGGLKEGSAIKSDGPTRLFFPNGIELIDIDVSAGATIEVKLKVAGEKGIAKP